MKLIKLFAPVGLAAILLLALIGPSLAMAESTALCKADEDPCSGGQLTNAMHYLADDMAIEGEEYEYECDALISATVLALGAPQVLHGEITYFSCSGNCTRTEVSEGFLLEVLRTGNELADVVGEGLEVLVVCGSTIRCVYDLKGITGQASGPLIAGENGYLTYIEAELRAVSGLFCPKARLTALFEPLSPTYIKS